MGKENLINITFDINMCRTWKPKNIYICMIWYIVSTTAITIAITVDGKY